MPSTPKQKKLAQAYQAEHAKLDAEQAVSALEETQRGQTVLKLFAALHKEAQHLDLCYRPFLTQLEKAAASQLINGTVTDLLQPFTRK